MKNNNNSEIRLLGCTNYLLNGNGCNTIMMPHNYTQDKEELLIRFSDKNVDINNIMYCGKSIKEMVNHNRC